MTDETNLQPSAQSRFFIYGGLACEVGALPGLHSAIKSIRSQHGLAAGDPLKFETRSRPRQISQEAYTEAKSKVIEVCIDQGVQFMVQLVSHDVASNTPADQLVEWAINTVLYVFNFKFLPDRDSSGIVLIDRLPGSQGFGYLRDKFSNGLSGQTWNKTLDRIQVFGVTCDGASHLSSAVDIVLGAFRYCVNAEDGNAVAANLLPQIARLLYHRRIGDTIYIRDHGLSLRPQEVRAPMYQLDYDRLVQRLSRLVPELPDIATARSN